MTDTTRPTRRPTNYIEPGTLAALLRDHRRTGVVSDDLGKALELIAGGLWDKHRYTADRDDFTQEAVLHLLGKPLEKADVQKNCFAFFTTCVIRFGWKLRDKAHADRRRFETYAAELVEAGVPLPTTE